MRKAFFFLCLLAIAPALPADDKLEQITVLAEGGATQLALRLLEKQQPPMTEADNWFRWEKQRFEIYGVQQDWDAVARRVGQLPADVPDNVRQWCLNQAARAMLKAGDAPAARRYLRQLLWQEQADDVLVAAWRRMVIRSYLLEDNVEDAQTALLRYIQDFNTKGAAWQRLHARVLLRADRPKDAFDILAGNQSHEGRLLRLLAGLRAGLTPASRVLADGLKLAEATRTKPEAQREAWFLVAEAAAALKDTRNRALGIELALSLPANEPAVSKLYRIGPDDLWQAYLDLAKAQGNARRLLVGDDAPWFRQAKSYKRDESLLARSLFAMVAQKGQQPESRLLAHERLVDSLLLDGRETAVKLLYLNSERYPGDADIPQIVRHRLADTALRAYDIELASRMIKGLYEPLEGEDPTRWTLRQARILIYGGEVEAAVEKMNGLLIGHPDLDDGFVGPYLQVLFDLQAINRHAEALDLLDQVFARAKGDRTRREMLFWMADSKKALGEHLEAAELYLRSAIYKTPQGGDMWGQSARFYAAEALAEAGLTEDARNVYRELLRHTTDAKQRAILERNVQRLWLWLREDATTTQ